MQTQRTTEEWSSSLSRQADSREGEKRQTVKADFSWGSNALEKNTQETNKNEIEKRKNKKNRH